MSYLSEHQEDVAMCVATGVLELVSPLMDGVYPARQVAAGVGGCHGDVFPPFLDLEVG